MQTLRRPYTIYNFKHPTETPSGEVVLPMDVLIPCVENATKLCVPGDTPICTTFSEIMCLEVLTATSFCEQYNTTCIKRKIPCLESDPLCQNKTEEELTVENDKTFTSVELPCFANITVNSNIPNFDIYSFNGTFPVGTNTSYTYHYHYCVTTLGIPGLETDVCLTTPSTKGVSASK
ncbi:hypothetical protein NQ314_019453 [Rhamnusium bicolor]|uniref:Uncharacterized protein n=1 Tax=Rhamnusium bicolor TaxID=1586634 RepID=A0AAV8WPF5_9CUCU|nr:hypothetical protein NQ314_019453 [Rhamnusium bicolor]